MGQGRAIQSPEHGGCGGKYSLLEGRLIHGLLGSRSEHRGGERACAPWGQECCGVTCWKSPA